MGKRESRGFKPLNTIWEKEMVDKPLLKRKIGGKIFTFYKEIKDSYQPFSESWETVRDLNRKGKEVAIKETKQKVGKRKPINIVEVWVRDKP